MINKYEALGILVCVGIMSLALFLLRVDANVALLGSISPDTQHAAVVVSANAVDQKQAVADALVDSINATGDMVNVVIDDITVGEGAEVKNGDTVSVHYIGTLQNGQQFDNSYVKGEPFTFTLGEGKVIKGWEEGIKGMKKGGQRILVIPPQFAYGSREVGPIPANATLVFSVELIDIK